MACGESNCHVIDDVTHVTRSYCSELITCSHATFSNNKIAWKNRKTANIIQKNRSLVHC